MGRPSKKNSKAYIARMIQIKRIHENKYGKLRMEIKMQRDVADLMNSIVNKISKEQMPSTDHPHKEHNYTLHSTNSTARSPNDRPTFCSIGTQTYFEEIFAPPKLRPREAIINGRRIVDFQYFYNELKDASGHSKSLCNLNNMIIANEEKNGIFTSYTLKCLVCNFEKKICSESPYRDTNLNADFVSSILSIECDFMDAYILLAQMHLPLLSNDEFIQECKNVCLTMDKRSQQTLLKTYRVTLSNLKKELRKRTLSRKLAALKQSFCEQEDMQKKLQLITTQQCSTVSDNSNIQRESQLTTMKQNSSAHENIQRKPQLATMKQNSSAHENIQRKPQLATMKENSSAHENIRRKPQLATMKQNSSAHENIQRKPQLATMKQNSSAHENIQLKPQLATMKQSSSAHENIQREHNLTTTQQCSSTSDNSNLFEQMHLDGLLVKDEFEIKEENVFEDENEFETMMPDQTTKTSYNKLISDQEQVILNTTTIKQEIDSDDENFNKSITKETTIRESVIVNDEQIVIGAMLTQTNEGRACKNTMVVNEEKIQLQKNVMVENNKINNILIKSEFHDRKITDKESVTNFDNKSDSESPLKKARTVTCKKSNNSRDTQRIPTTAPNKEKSVFQSRFKSNRLLTGTSTTKNMRNEVATSSITNVRNATATVSVTTASGGSTMFSIPVKFNENGGLIFPQNPHDKASGTYKGVSETASIPEIPSAMQQPTSIPNAIPNASGTTCVPLVSTAVQQPTVSSKARPKVRRSPRKC